MNDTPTLVGPTERYPAEWQLSATVALTGLVAMVFTTGTEPTDDSPWVPALWADTDATQTSRGVSAVIAGSQAAQPGDGAPGIGDFTAWIRYTTLDGMVRIRRAGRFNFR